MYTTTHEICTYTLYIFNTNSLTPPRARFMSERVRVYPMHSAGAASPLYGTCFLANVLASNKQNPKPTPAPHMCGGFLWRSTRQMGVEGLPKTPPDRPPPPVPGGRNGTNAQARTAARVHKTKFCIINYGSKRRGHWNCAHACMRLLCGMYAYVKSACTHARMVLCMFAVWGSRI